MGLGLSSLTPEARKTFNLADNVNGVVITKVDPDSDAADKGLQPGDVVLQVGNRTVRTPPISRPAWPKPRRAAARACCCWWRTARAAPALSPSISTRHDVSGGAAIDLRAAGGHLPLPPARPDFRKEICMRILVVEDDLEAQRYLVQGLKESGHVVDDAADGETGLTPGAVAAL